MSRGDRKDNTPVKNTGSSETSNEAFEARARELLQASEHDILPDVNEQLAAMRRAAVRELDERSATRQQTSGYWMPVGAIAVVVLTLGVFLYSGSESLPLFDDLDETQLAAAQEMELLEELEFLAWMEEEENNAG